MESQFILPVSALSPTLYAWWNLYVLKSSYNQIVQIDLAIHLPLSWLYHIYSSDCNLKQICLCFNVFFQKVNSRIVWSNLFYNPMLHNKARMCIHAFKGNNWQKSTSVRFFFPGKITLQIFSIQIYKIINKWEDDPSLFWYLED